jgi:hypothetical protein
MNVSIGQCLCSAMRYGTYSTDSIGTSLVEGGQGGGCA